MPGFEDADAKAALAAEWFEPGETPLEQGDILIDFPLPAMTFDAENGLRVERRKQTTIVVTQSCDVPKPAQTGLLLASVFDYSVIRETSDAFKGKDYREALSKGTVQAEFALPPRPDGNGQFMVVSFRKLHVVPKAYVEAHLSNDHLRIVSPYKEYFAQAYARFMMRVGLPSPMMKIK